jgi:sialate O-acetylesterase
MKHFALKIALKINKPSLNQPQKYSMLISARSSLPVRRHYLSALRPALAALFLVFAPHGLAAVPSILFSDHAVLQRQKPVPVWGTGAPGEKVSVRFSGQTKDTTVNASGKWRVRLNPMEANRNPQDLTIVGAETLVIRDVLVGEVWVASGQSNMAMSIDPNLHKEVADKDWPLLRMRWCDQPAVEKPTDQLTMKDAWAVCNRPVMQARVLSAVGFFFIKSIHERFPDVPIGLIQPILGGTPIESWMSREAQVKDAEIRAFCDAALADEKRDGAHRPGYLFNGMINPLMPFAIRGVIWYQGETSVDHSVRYYRSALLNLMADWRGKWGQGEFPFYVVQLANLGDVDNWRSASGRVNVRQAQLEASLRDAHSGLAVTIDLGDAKDVHYANNRDIVGHRLALNALVKDYGLKLEWSGPLYESMRPEGAALRLTFSHAKGMASKGGGPLQGFIVAGEDEHFQAATAIIKGNTVLVSSPLVPKPTMVRYLTSDSPSVCNLVNADGLQASPFMAGNPENFGTPVPIRNGTFADLAGWSVIDNPGATTPNAANVPGQGPYSLGRFLIWGNPNGTIRQEIPLTDHAVAKAGDHYQLRFYVGAWGEAKGMTVDARLLAGGKPVASLTQSIVGDDRAWSARSLNYTSQPADVGQPLAVEFHLRQDGAGWLNGMLGDVTLALAPAGAKPSALISK